MFVRPTAFFIHALAVLTLAMMSLPVQADELGSPAWVLSDTVLNTGPGTHYPTTTSLNQGDAVVIGRCSQRWCQIGTTDAWLSMDNLSFGQAPKGPVSGPKFDILKGGPGQVCLYEGANYSGASICQGPGSVVRDLALTPWDNRVSSLSIEGDVSITLCRDRGFSSLCTLFTRSTPRLERLLSSAVSSWQIW